LHALKHEYGVAALASTETTGRLQPKLLVAITDARSAGVVTRANSRLGQDQDNADNAYLEHWLTTIFSFDAVQMDITPNAAHRPPRVLTQANA
jgi:hypothetical protein